MASGGAEQPLDSAAESVARLWQPVAEGPNHRVAIRIDRGRALITVWRLAPGLLLSLLVSSPSHHHSVIPTVALLAVFLGVSISSAISRRTLITFDDSGFQAGKGSYCEWPELTAIRILERRTPSGGLRGVQQLHLLGGPVSDDPLQHRILGVVDPNLMSIPADVVIDMLLKHRKVPVERQAASLFTLRIGGTTRRYARAERLLLGFLTAASLLIVFSGVVTVASGRVVTGLCTLAAGSGIATYCFRASQKSDKVVRPVVIGGNTTVEALKKSSLSCSACSGPRWVCSASPSLPRVIQALAWA